MDGYAYHHGFDAGDLNAHELTFYNLGILVVLWGTVTTCTGAIQDFNGLIICRVFLGVTESGFFPAATYLVSVWYCRFEVQTRIGIFYCAASLAGAFSGLLAFAISKMDGVANLVSRPIIHHWPIMCYDTMLRRRYCLPP
jgi:MFS family permease